MRRLFLLILPAILACGGGGGDSAPARKTLIDSRDTYDPRSLDPALSTDVPTGRAVAYVFDGLTRFTPDAKVVPGLAKSWELTPDGLTYTFHLRSGVKFHDGRPLTARNVLSSFQRVLDPATKGGRGWPLYPIKGAEDYAAGKGGKSISGMSAPNDTTVVITLKEPFSIFPKLLAMPVASIIPDNPASNFGQNPIGTGPWKFVEWKHDDYLRFAKNPDYFDGPPRSDSLMARIIPEASTATAEFEAGNVDVLNVPDEAGKSWQADPQKSKLLSSAPALRFWYVAINTTRGPLSDVRVRQALNYAVDVNTMLSQVMAGRGSVANGVIPPSLGGASNRKPYGYDVNKAKQLLAAAGHPNGIDVELWASTTDQSPRISQTLQANLAAAGIRAKIIPRDASSMREAARKGQTDLALKEWWADYPDAENFLYPLLHSKNKGVGGNVSFYGNPKFDALVDQAHHEQDEAKRNDLYTQADQVEFNDAPMIYLFFYKDMYAVQPWIKGFTVPAVFSGQRWTDVTISK